MKNRRLFLIVFALIFVGLLACQSAFAISSTSSIPISAENPMAVMRISYSTSPFISPGGVMYAMPVKSTDCYELYDVIIWPDRISMYKFPNNYEDGCNQYIREISEREPIFDKAIISQLFTDYREQFLLESYMLATDSSDAHGNQSVYLTAYKSFFKQMYQLTPSQHMMVKYSGHGGGSMFAKSLEEKNAKKLMQYVTNLIGHKLAIIDYGTNCNSGTTSTLNTYQDYVDYMIVSQPSFGGYDVDSWNLEDSHYYDCHYNYNEPFVSGSTTREIAINIAALNTRIWDYAVETLKRENVEEAVTVVKMSSYKSLMTAMKKAGKVKGNAVSLKTQVKKYKKASLLDKYNKAVIYYKNNAAYLSKKWSGGNGIAYMP